MKSADEGSAGVILPAKKLPPVTVIGVGNV